MKTLCIAALLLLTVSHRMSAGQHTAPPQASAEFERMKSLLGTWKGNTDMGQGPMEFTVEYRLCSGGRAPQKRTLGGTPKGARGIAFPLKGTPPPTPHVQLGN